MSKKQSYAPEKKIVAAGIAGSITILLVWLVQTFTSVVVPAEVSSAITAIISVLAGYIKSN